MTTQAARDFLAKNKIRWIIEGQYERQFAGETSMAKNLGLTPLWSGGDAQGGLTVVYAAP